METARKPLTRACWLVAAVGLLLATAAWERLAPLTVRPAQAQQANPADDRQSMLAELRGINEKMDRLISLLDSGKVKMIVANAEEVRGASPAPGNRPDGERPRVGEPGVQPVQPGQPGGEEPKIIVRQKADHAGN
jgi:hypothetical protein